MTSCYLAGDRQETALEHLRVLFALRASIEAFRT
jgi:hypothetical protein